MARRGVGKTMLQLGLRQPSPLVEILDDSSRNTCGGLHFDGKPTR